MPYRYLGQLGCASKLKMLSQNRSCPFTAFNLNSNGLAQDSIERYCLKRSAPSSRIAVKDFVPHFLQCRLRVSVGSLPLPPRLCPASRSLRGRIQ